MLLGSVTILSGFVGCLDSGPPVDSAFVSFSGSEKGVAVEVVTGDFDSLWVEIENVDGGFMIDKGSDGPSLYIDNDGYSTAGDICYKTSRDATCLEGSLDEDTRDAFHRDAEIRVYGILDGEKTLLETYARN